MILLRWNGGSHFSFLLHLHRLLLFLLVSAHYINSELPIYRRYNYLQSSSSMDGWEGGNEIEPLIERARQRRRMELLELMSTISAAEFPIRSLFCQNVHFLMLPHSLLEHIMDWSMDDAMRKTKNDGDGKNMDRDDYCATLFFRRQICTFEPVPREVLHFLPFSQAGFQCNFHGNEIAQSN